MTTTNTTPTLSLPALSPSEVRHIVAPGHSRSLVSFVEWKGTPDLSRMTETAVADLIIFPTFSDGSEYLAVLDEFDTISTAMREDGKPGLTLDVTLGRGPSAGRTETWNIDGYLRVHRHRT